MVTYARKSFIEQAPYLASTIGPLRKVSPKDKRPSLFLRRRR